MMKVPYYRILLCLVFAATSLAVFAADDETLRTYYGAASGKGKAELKSALHEIIGWADVLDYGSGEGRTWFGFYHTDRMDNNEVRDRYSNEHHYFNNASYTAVAGMNIEHSFPKSWWGGTKNQAYKDLHHLMPSESRINTSKSNYGIGRVTNVKTDNGCTKVGRGPGPAGEIINLWEPADEWKGDFARVIFYMATCYSNLTWQGSEALKSFERNDWPTLQPWVYNILLEWSREDPVDDIETTRNEIVYTIQGNRNPFIDYPDMAEYIWGAKTDKVFNIDGSNNDNDNPGPVPVPSDSTLILYQNFLASAGDFTAVQADGTRSAVWQRNATYGMVCNAYNFGADADEWLITPRIDLTDVAGATLEFSHAVGYHNEDDPAMMLEVIISTDYAQRPFAATWDVLDVEWPMEMIPGSRFTRFTSSGTVSLDHYAGHVVNVAFHYTSDAEYCWAWELKNVTVKGKPLPTGIDDNYMSPIDAEDAVFDLSGNYLGRDIPARRGIFIVRRGGYTFKKFQN